MNIHLAKVLVKENVISLDQFKATVEEQRRTKKRLGEVLISLGFINESELLDFLSKEYGVPVVNLDEMDIDEAILKDVPRKTVLEHRLIPIGRTGSNLVVAMSDPSNIIAIDDLRFATGYNIKPVVAPERAIENVIERYYGAEDDTKERVRVERGEEQIDRVIQELEDLKKNKNESGASSSKEVPESAEPESELGPESEKGQAFSPTGVSSGISEPERSQEELIFQAQENEQYKVSLSPPESSSQSIEVVETDVSSYAAEDEAVDPDNHFWHVHRTQEEEGASSEEEDPSKSLETMNYEEELLEGEENETNVPRADSFFTRGSEPEYSGEEALNEPVYAEENLDPLRSPLSVRSIEEEQSEKEKDFDPTSLFTGQPEPDINSQEIVMESVVEGTISYSLSPVSVAPDSGSAPIDAEKSSNEVPFDPSSFFTQIYGHWEDQEEAQPLTGEEGKVIEQSSSYTESESCQTKDEVADEVVIEDDIPDSLFAHDYEPQHDQEYVDFESAEEDSAIDPFRAPTSYQGSPASPLTKEPAAGLKEKEDHSEPDGNLFSKADVPDSSTSDTAEREEVHANDRAVVELNEETFPPTEPDRELSTQKTVLVVDDSPTIQKIVAITLERKGYGVFIAANAMQALAKLNEVIPDLIFLDINLPHMDGYKLCRVINDLGLGKNVPIIMLSGKDGLFEEMRGKIAGATGFISKPFEPSTLIHTVEKYVS
jgi:CheY-like chemotaxis protein